MEFWDSLYVKWDYFQMCQAECLLYTIVGSVPVNRDKNTPNNLANIQTTTQIRVGEEMRRSVFVFMFYNDQEQAGLTAFCPRM